MEEVSHLIIKVSSDDVAKATRSLDSLGRASDKITGLIKGLVTAAAAMMVFRQAASAIAEFDHNMQGVLAVTKATTEEMEKLRDMARQIGSTTQISGAEAAMGMKLLGQAGFSTSQIIAAMPGMLDLAVAGELDLASAADIVGAALAGFRLKAGDAAKVADVLAVAAGESNTSVFQMGDAMKYVAPIAAGMNKSIEEVSAAIGVLSNAGLQGSMAGTGLRQVLSSLASPTKEAADVLYAYGITMDEVNPEIHSLAAVIDRLKVAGISASDALIIAGDRGGNALVALTSQAEGFHKLNASMGNVAGRAKEMATILGDDLTGDMKKLRGATNELFLALGDAGLREVMRGVAQETRDFTLAMADLVKSGEAAAWVDLILHKLTFLADGFYNAADSITQVWGMAMEYVGGTGKEASDDILSAFINLPENVRAVVQGIAAAFSTVYLYAEAVGEGMRQIFVANFKNILISAENMGRAMRDILTGTLGRSKDDLFNFKPLIDTSAVFSASLLQVKQSVANATAAWEEQVTAIMDERDTNLASSEAKLRKIDELRAAYAKLQDARKAAESDAAKNAGVVGNAPNAPKGPTHFNTQEFELLRKSLQLEEKTIQESYTKRLDLIRRNTEEGSALRMELETALNERMELELNDAHGATIDRLTAQHQVEQANLQMALDQRLISEAEYQEKSRAAWNAYTKGLVNVGTKGASQVTTNQLEMWSHTLSMASNIAGLMSDLVGQNNSAAKAMFAISKAIAIAEILVNTHVGAAKAVGMMGPFGIPMASYIMATGYASAALTAAIAIGQFEHGGMIPAGQVGMTQEAGFELVKGPAVVTSARNTADLLAGDRNGGKPQLTLIVNNNNGSAITAEERDTPDGKIVELIIDKAHKRVANDIRAGGGPVSSALAGTFQLRRGLSA